MKRNGSGVKSRLGATLFLAAFVLSSAIYDLGPKDRAAAQVPAGKAGRILVSGHSVEVTAKRDYLKSMGSNFIGSNVTGHRSILQKSIRWVTREKAFPRFLYVTQYEPDQLEGAGFPECSSPLADPSLSRGCLEVSYQGYQGPCVECRDDAYPKRVNIENVDFAKYDAVVVSNTTTRWQVDVLNRRGAEIVAYINGGGGWLQFPEEDSPRYNGRDVKDELGFLCLKAFDVYIASDPDRRRVTIAPLGREIGFTSDDVYQEGPLEGGVERIRGGGAQEMVVEQTHNDAHTIGSLFKPNGTMDFEPVTYLPENWSYAHVRRLRVAVGKDLAKPGTSPLPVCGVNDTSAGEATAETTPATFVLTIPSGHPSDFKFRFTTRDGTAVAGRDYQPVSGEVVFKGSKGHWTYYTRGGQQKRLTYIEPGPNETGEYRKEISVPILKDSEFEPEEDFFLDVAFIDEQGDCYVSDSTAQICGDRSDNHADDENPFDDHYPSVWGTCEGAAMECAPDIFPGKALYLHKQTGVGKIIDGVVPPEIPRLPDRPEEYVPPSPEEITDEFLGSGGVEPADEAAALAQEPPQPPQQPQLNPGGESAPTPVQPAQPAALQPQVVQAMQPQANLATSPQTHVQAQTHIQTQAQVQAAPMMQKQREIELQRAENKPVNGGGKTKGLQASGPTNSALKAAALSLVPAMMLVLSCGSHPKTPTEVRVCRVAARTEASSRTRLANERRRRR